MNFSGNNLLQTGARGRFVLSMLLLAWLNIATQPCLMAMEMAPDMTVASEHTAHSEHAEHLPDAIESSDCGHCPSAAEHQEYFCETGSASDCELFPGYNVDGRQFKEQLKDVSPPLLLSTVESTLEFSTSVTSVSLHDSTRQKFAGDPPLNIRHCVFLK